MKRQVTLTGRLLSPLQVGAHAIILCEYKYIRTSPIVRVMEKTEHAVTFETIHTVYHIMWMPVSAKVASSPLMMCA